MFDPEEIQIYTQPAFGTISTWTVDRINRVLDEHDQGYFSASSQLIDGLLRRTPRFQATMGSRVREVLSLPFRVDPARPSGAIGKRVGAREARIAREVEKVWFTSYFVPGKGKADLCESTLGQLLFWGISIGVGIAQIVPEVKNGRWIPRLQVWHPQWIYWNISTKSYWVMTQEGVVEIIPGNGQWLLFTPYGYEGGWLDALVRSLSHWCLIASLTMRDWARFSEVLGNAIKMLKVPAGVDKKDKTYQLVMEALRKMGRDGVMVIPQGDTASKSYGLDLLEAKSQSWQSFKELKTAANEEITIAVKGENLTTEVKQGSMAAADTQAEGKQSTKQYDAEGLMTALEEQMIVPYVAFNEGPGDLAPHPVLDYQPPANKERLATVAKTGAEALVQFRALNAPIDERAFLASLGLPLIDAPEEAA